MTTTENMTAKQAAAYLGVPVRTFYDLGIPCYKYSDRCRRWARTELEEYKAKCRSTSSKQKAAGVIHTTQ